jgi:hypothetical protein
MLPQVAVSKSLDKPRAIVDQLEELGIGWVERVKRTVATASTTSGKFLDEEG